MNSLLNNQLNYLPTIKIIKNKLCHSLVTKIQYLSHKEQKRKFFKIIDGQKLQEKQIVLPKQYPKGSLNDTTPIISRGRPTKYLTPRYQIEDEKMMDQDFLINQKQYAGKWKSPLNAYSLNIGLIGPINAGKSQLFGALSYPISAVSPKAATTVQIIHGLKSFQKESEEKGIKNVQLKYFDTPGLMYKKEGFISRGWKVLSDIDFTLFVVDSAKRFDNMTKQSIKRLQKHRQYPNFMKALVLNKIDLVDNRRKFDNLITEIQRHGKFDKIFYTSAKTGYGIKELEDYLITMAKQSQWEHPAETKTTQTQVQIMEQMLRSGLYHRCYKQVPHNLDIICKSYVQKSNGICEIIFDIYLQTQNQQRMIIGKQGRNINDAISLFKVSFAKYYDKQAEVYTSVKIRNKYKQQHRGREQIIINDYDRQDQQKLKVIQDYLGDRKFKGHSSLSQIISPSTNQNQ